MVTTGKTQEALAVAASDPSTRALHTPKPGGRWQGAQGRAARAGRAGAAGVTWRLLDPARARCLPGAQRQARRPEETHVSGTDGTGVTDVRGRDGRTHGRPCRAADGAGWGAFPPWTVPSPSQTWRALYPLIWNLLFSEENIP